MSTKSPLRRWAAKRTEQFPALARAVRTTRLVRGAYRQAAGEFTYDPSDVWRHERLERKVFMRKAFRYLTFNGIDGDYAEFGSHGAVTFSLAWAAAALYGRPIHLWAFDSFAGLPEAVDERDAHVMWVEGSMTSTEAVFHRLCAERGVPRGSYTTVPGFYRETLAPGATGPRPPKIALAYVDCDLYSSTRDVLSYLRDHLHQGMLLAFDDYYCDSPEGPSGERLAMRELFEPDPQWRLEPYLQFGWHGMSFVVDRR